MMKKLLILLTMMSSLASAQVNGVFNQVKANGPIIVGGAIPAIHFTMTNLSTMPSSWTFDYTTPTTALQSVLPGVSSGGSGEITANAATASASDHVPSQCAADMWATGVTATWAANCLGLPAKGNAGTYTSLMSITFDAQGRETSATAGAAVPRTCNSYGCYKIDADGTITEWGYVSPSQVTTNFPYAFTTAVQSFVVSSTTVGGAYSDPAYGNYVTLSTFLVSTRNSNSGSLSSYGVSWYAIGY